jgi:hypothetical protein
MVALVLQFRYARSESRELVIFPTGFLHRQRGAS